ncbi:MAG: hypothetical protein CR972_00270 [Candidatus Moraniibacteriota bacterium]|nr:MAG: hypothetical protein CR972_00270 [Candidatus Moranbacteria bacterium]
MFEILDYLFFQRALIILLTASIVAGTIGPFIVAKRISMISGSISHGAFGGLGIAHYFGFSPIFGALCFSILGAGMISHISQKHKNYLDSMLTIFWAGGMAIGLIFVFITTGYATNLFSFLFGNVLLNSANDLYIIIGVTTFIVTSVIIIYKTLIATLFNEEFAQLRGVSTSAVFFFFLLLVALAIVVLIKTMGVVLTLAILTISPAIAIRYLKKLHQIIFVSIILNIITAISGLFLAYFINLPTAPVIILLQTILFLVSLFLKKR